MTTTAICGGYRICQSFLGAKIHDAKDPGADLSAMLTQVVGSVFQLMETYEAKWMETKGSREVPLFGFRYGVGLEPIEVNLERMVRLFCSGLSDLREVWDLVLHADTARELFGLEQLEPQGFHLPDKLWVQVIYDFAAAYRRRVISSEHLLRSLTPIYLGRVASFVVETRDSYAEEVEEKIERLCLLYEEHKPRLVQQWRPLLHRHPGQQAPAVQLTQPSHA
jgi:hypothetical protein